MFYCRLANILKKNYLEAEIIVMFLGWIWTKDDLEDASV